MGSRRKTHVISQHDPPNFAYSTGPIDVDDDDTRGGTALSFPRTMAISDTRASARSSDALRLISPAASSIETVEPIAIVVVVVVAVTATATTDSSSTFPPRLLSTEVPDNARTPLLLLPIATAAHDDMDGRATITNARHLRNRADMTTINNGKTVGGVGISPIRL